jgi:hypothetical protein
VLVSDIMKDPVGVIMKVWQSMQNSHFSKILAACHALFTVEEEENKILHAVTQ